MRVEDLEILAARADLSLSISVCLEDEAQGITSAFCDYSMLARAVKNRAAAGNRLDWCNTVKRQAHELQQALGYLDDEGCATRDKFRDGIEMLRPGWPTEPEDGHGVLVSLAWHLEPAIMATVGKVSEMPKWLSDGWPIPHDVVTATEAAKDAFYQFMRDRMLVGLRMLQLLAERAAVVYEPHVKPKRGKETDHALHSLFAALAGSYERMFGRRSGVSNGGADGSGRESTPAGKAMNWHAALLDHVAARAIELGRPPGSTGPVSKDDLDPELRPLVALRDRANRSHAGDTLAGWLRPVSQNTKQAKTRRA